MDKRTLLKAMLGGMGVAIAGIVGVPVTVNAIAPAFQERRRGLWQVLGDLDDFALGTITPTVVERPRVPWAQTLQHELVYVWRPAEPEEEDVVVFSRSCTDLSCPVRWDPGSQWFYCPCHGGIFAMSGEPVKGPPRRPLYRYETRVRDGLVEIDLGSVPPIA